MRKSLLLVLFALISVAFTGCEPPIQSGVNVDNLNEAASEDALIRVWVLDEEQIENPPTTRAEADAVENLVTYPSNIYQFQREAGNYFVVASNETHFQGLAPEDSFSAGEDFSLLAVEVSDGFLEIGVKNTDTPTLLPEITEL